MQKIDVVFAPDLYQYHNKSENVVLIDVARFTSTMVTALANGALSVETYPDTETPLRLKAEQGYLIAGEVHGENIPGYDFNNSPVAMTPENVAGRKMAFCTSNGTYTRSIIYDYETIIAASFLNCAAVCKRLLDDSKSVLLVCSGRSRKPAIEDLLLAGKIADCLIKSGKYESKDDSANIAITLYNISNGQIKDFTLKTYPLMAEYARKYPSFGKDIDFALTDKDVFDIVPEETSPFKFEIKK